jgi:hypothetical protein
MKVKVQYDYPTVEGMIYSGSIMVCEQENFNKSIHDEKVKGKLDTGKLVWIPKKLLKKM